MDCSTPGSPVLHYLPESAQIHVHWVSDAIQPSHPLSSPSHFAFNLSQNQGLFQWVSSSHQVAKVLELASASVLSMTIWDWFSFRTDWFDLLAVQGILRWLDSITDSMDMNLSNSGGDSGGQRSLVCCSPWAHRVGHYLAKEQQLSIH